VALRAREGVDLVLTDIDAAKLAQASRDDNRRQGHEPSFATCCQPLVNYHKCSTALFSSRSRGTYPGHCRVSPLRPGNAMCDAYWRRLMAINLLAPIQITRIYQPARGAEEAHTSPFELFVLVPVRQLATYQAHNTAWGFLTLAITATTITAIISASLIFPVW